VPDQFTEKSFSGGGTKNQGFSTNAFERMNGGFGNKSMAGGSKTTDAATHTYGPPPSKKEKPSYTTVTAKPKEVVHMPAADFVPSDTSNLQAGQRVEHQKFGFGLVKLTEGSAHNPVATVLFDLNGEKKIMLNYAKLRIVE